MNFTEGLEEIRSHAEARAEGRSTAPFVPSSISTVLDATHFVETASILATLMEMAEIAGREGPDLLHGGIVSYFDDEGVGRYTYSTASRPLPLEFLGDGLWAGADDQISQAFDSRLALVIQLWPVPWMESCYLATARHITGERCMILIGPQNQYSALPLASAAFLTDRLSASRIESQNFSACSVMDAIDFLGGMDVTNSSDWDVMLLSRAEVVNAVRTACNDLFADLWSNASCFVLLKRASNA